MTTTNTTATIAPNTNHDQLIRRVKAHEAALARLSRARRDLDEANAAMGTALVCGHFFAEGSKERNEYLRVWSFSSGLAKFAMNEVNKAKAEVEATFAALTAR